LGKATGVREGERGGEATIFKRFVGLEAVRIVVVLTIPDTNCFAGEAVDGCRGALVGIGACCWGVGAFFAL